METIERISDLMMENFNSHVKYKNIEKKKKNSFKLIVYKKSEVNI
jgi:hypothetical protein